MSAKLWNVGENHYLYKQVLQVWKHFQQLNSNVNFTTMDHKKVLTDYHSDVNPTATEPFRKHGTQVNKIKCWMTSNSFPPTKQGESIVEIEYLERLGVTHNN